MMPDASGAACILPALRGSEFLPSHMTPHRRHGSLRMTALRRPFCRGIIDSGARGWATELFGGNRGWPVQVAATTSRSLPSQAVAVAKGRLCAFVGAVSYCGRRPFNILIDLRSACSAVGTDCRPRIGTNTRMAPRPTQRCWRGSQPSYVQPLAIHAFRGHSRPAQRANDRSPPSSGSRFMYACPFADGKTCRADTPRLPRRGG